jgi:hypothetical protein
MSRRLMAIAGRGGESRPEPAAGASPRRRSVILPVGRLAVLLAAVLCSGCFALDDRCRQQEMDRYGARQGREGRSHGRGEEPTPAERARQWWDSARTFEPRSEDAKSDIVSCKVGGATRFMSETDCQNSGGRVSGGG